MKRRSVGWLPGQQGTVRPFALRPKEINPEAQSLLWALARNRVEGNAHFREPDFLRVVDTSLYLEA